MTVMSPQKKSKVNHTQASFIDSIEHFVPRKIPSQNVAFRLMMRELQGGSPYSNEFSRDHRGRVVDTTRGFFLNVFPNYTLVNVEKPPCFLRKFTPDGRYFIAFSPCQTQLEVYLFLGPAAGGSLVHDCTKNTPRNSPPDFLGNEDTQENNNLRNNIFKTFFRQVACVSLAHNGEQLNRECSLFSECGKKVIVGSASYISDDPHPLMHEIYRNNESVSPNPRNPLENYTLYSVDLVDGLLCDTIKFRTDKIFLSHNQGIYLYKNILAILSVQHQTIHIYRYSSDGKFVPMLQIGRTLHDTDEYLLTMTGQSNGQQTTSLPGNRNPYRNFRENVINQLKHRILTFLYRRAVSLTERDGNLFELRKFYQFFDQIKNLRMWKMQLLDENHVLIKYASEEVVTLRSSEPNAQISLFVIYNMTTTEVTSVYDNTSEELLDMFEMFCDFFRNTNTRNEGQGNQVTSSPANNIHANLIQQRFKQTIVSAKNGGLTEARKRLLAQLPISAQSYTTTPYLDFSLFSYDEKWVSVMERPKACGEHAILFYGRDCGLLKFKIYAGVQGRQAPPSARKLVAFIFHPTDPFAISVQRTNLEYVVNFHVRKPPQT